MIKVGDAVLVHKGRPVTLPCGIQSNSGHSASVIVTALDPEKATVTWRDNNMDRTVPFDAISELPCCWIIGQTINSPMAKFNKIEKPLASLGVKVLFIPMSPIEGLFNVPSDGTVDPNLVLRTVKELIGG